MKVTIRRDDIRIGIWIEGIGDKVIREYRAVFVGDCVLTGPEHAHLPDAALLDEAVAEARRAEVYAEDEDQ